MKFPRGSVGATAFALLSLATAGYSSASGTEAGHDDLGIYVTTVVVRVTTTICPTSQTPISFTVTETSSSLYHPDLSSALPTSVPPTSVLPTSATRKPCASVAPDPVDPDPPAATNMALKRDWRVDGSDYNQLDAKNSCNMFYTDATVESGTQPADGNPLAWVSMLNMTYPMIQLENTVYVDKVWCESSSGVNHIHMQFIDSGAYNHAWENWHDITRPGAGDYVVLTDVPGCRTWTDHEERHFLRATNEERDNNTMTITCAVESIPFSEAVGDENNVAVKWENMGKGNGEDGSFSAQANDAPQDASFNASEPLLRDPSGDSDFDSKLDLEIGRMDLQTLNSGLQGQFNITLDDFFGESDLPNLVQKHAKRRLLSKIKKAVKKVVAKVKQVVNKVVDKVVEVAEKVVEVAKDVADAIAEFTTIRQSIGTNADFDTLTIGQVVTTPFDGQRGYRLFEASRPDAQMEVFCVGCGVQGDFRINGQVEFVVSRLKFETGFIEITGDMSAALQLGLVASFSAQGSVEREAFSKEFDKRIVSIPLTPFAIPGIFVLGPKISLDAGIDVGVDASGQILAGVKVEWPDIQATLDIVDNKRSAVSGFRPDVTPVFEASGQVAVTAGVFLRFSLGVGIDVLNGKFDKSVALVDQPRVFATAGIGGEFDLENGFEPDFEGCRGIDFTVGFTNDVIFDLFGLEFPIFSIEVEAFKRCFEIFRRRNMLDGISPRGGALPPVHLALLSGRNDDINGPPSTETTFEGGILSQMTSHDEDGSFRLHFSPNGNTYAVPVSKAPDAQQDWSSWFASDPSGAFIIGDASGRFYHGYRDIILEHGVSRLRLHKPNSMPKTAQLMILAGVLNDSPQDEGAVVSAPEDGNTWGNRSLPYMMASDLGGDVYFPIVCVYESGSVYPKVFVANDTENAVATLMSNAPEIIENVTGGNVTECGYIPLTNGLVGFDITDVPEEDDV